jgi:hypothetical protein
MCKECEMWDTTSFANFDEKKWSKESTFKNGIDSGV